MPKYTFNCKTCGKSLQKYAPANIKDIQCTCGKQSIRQMPNLSASKTTETVDKLLGRKHTTDHDNTVKSRKLHFYWEVEVPKMVNSGVYSLETMLEQGWVYYNEKNELTTRTKPMQRS